MFEHVLIIIAKMSPVISLVLLAFLTSFFTSKEKRNVKIIEIEKGKRKLEKELILEKANHEKELLKNHLDKIDKVNDKISISLESLSKDIKNINNMVKLNSEEIDIIKNESSENKKVIKTITKDLLQITNTLDRQKIDTDNKLSKLSTISKLSLNYTQGVGELLVTFATGMKENQMNGNITEAVDKLKKTEKELFKEITKEMF